MQVRNQFLLGLSIGFVCLAVGVVMLARSNSELSVKINKASTTVQPEGATIPLHVLALIDAIAEVESGHNPRAISGVCEGVGVLQITPIMVEDVNRILGEPHYTLNDRFYVDQSVRMFWTYSVHYARHHADFSVEGIARRWNGGPDGHLEGETLVYWERIQHVLYGPEGQDTASLAEADRGMGASPSD